MIFTLTNSHGLEVRAIPLGGIIMSLRAPDRRGRLANIVLGFDTPEQYLDNRRYLGAIVGRSVQSSVANSYGQTHELPNLYIAGPGIFSTEGASNPTYTIFALSLRGAEQMAANWSTVAG